MSSLLVGEKFCIDERTVGIYFVQLAIVGLQDSGL